MQILPFADPVKIIELKGEYIWCVVPVYAHTSFLTIDTGMPLRTASARFLLSMGAFLRLEEFELCTTPSRSLAPA